jgi:chromosomal replication initiator protein
MEHIWSRVQAELARAVDDSTYRIWLAPLRALEVAPGRLAVEAPPEACAWIAGRFGRLLAASATLVLGEDTRVELVAHTGDPGGRRRTHSEHRSPPPSHLADGGAGARWAATVAGGEPGSHYEASPLANPKLTFEQFVIGDCNRLAHAAALAVAELPAQAYNPLFIYGPPGVGKTHLLASIARLARSHTPDLRVRCCTGESFTSEFLGALGGGSTDVFKSRFRDIDVLLLDDVQFLERKARTEEEFFHTFNALHDGGRQIVLTSDRPPDDLQALEDRLRERFQAGLVADIQPPELHTRLAILRKRAQHDGIEVADEAALGVLAERVRENVRALEGALIRAVAYGSLTGRALTAELAHEVLDSLHARPRGRRPSRACSVADIQAAACAHFGLTPEELLSPVRAVRVAAPRQLAMLLARELTDESLPAIGRKFGGRDHTTVLHACRRASARMAGDERLRMVVEEMRRELQPGSSASPDRHD